MRVSRFRVRDGKGSESCDVMLSLLSCVHRHPQLSSHIWRLLLHFTALLVFKMEADIRLIEKLLVIHCHTRNGRLYAFGADTASASAWHLPIGPIIDVTRENLHNFKF